MRAPIAALVSALALPACGDDVGTAPDADTTSAGTDPLEGGSSSGHGDGPGASEEVSGHADAADTTSADDPSTGGDATEGSGGDTTEGVVDDTTTGEPPSPCDTLDCDDADPCTDDTCDETTRACVHTPAPGNPCDDGDACTEGDTCQPDGTCGPGDDVCTIEHCGTIAADETWGPEAVHVLTCAVYVEGLTNPTLTILDGTTVLAEPGTSLWVGNDEPGRMEVQGAAQGVLFSAADPVPGGEWFGLGFGAHHTDSAISGATIELTDSEALTAGSADGAALVVTNSVIRNNAAAGIIVANESNLQVHDSAVLDNEDHGIFVLDYATLQLHGTSVVGNGGDGVNFQWGGTIADVESPFTNNVITQNGGAPMRMEANDVRHLDTTSSFAGNGEPIAIGGASVSTSGTWRLLDEDYRVLGVGIGGNTVDPVVIDVEAGVTFLVDQGAHIWVGYNGSSGVLNAVGTAALPIRIIGGTVWFTGVPSEPGPPSVLDHVIVESGEGIEIFSDASLNIVDSVVRDNDGVAGIGAYEGVVGISGTLVENNSGPGVFLGGPLAFPFADNIVSGNGASGWMYADVPEDLAPSSTFIGNTEDAISILGDVSGEDMHWPLVDVPYRVNDIEVTHGATLTLDPGVTIEIWESGGFEVGRIFDTVNGPLLSPGALVAVGTPAAPITFRSASPAPSAGDWAGILVHPHALFATLEHCVVQHAGGDDFDGAIVVQSDAVSISSCAITDSASWGIYQDGATATLSGNTFAGNALGDVFP